MEVLACFFIFFLGLAVGSFLNCFICRLALPGFSFKNWLGLKSRSYCPHCRHTLSWQDLMPVFSFVFLKGKCRYCCWKISWQYPLVETAVGAIFLLVFVLSGGFDQGLLKLIYFWAISSLLVVIFVYDLRHYIIPDSAVFPAIAIAGIFTCQFLISGQFEIFGRYLLSAAGAALFFFIVEAVSAGQWMGSGDVKLAFLIGLFLGWPSILIGLLSAFYAGAATGLGLIIFKKKKLKSRIPFGPFLVGGTFVALFFGEQLTGLLF